MTRAQEVATLQQENAAVKRQAATLTRQLAALEQRRVKEAALRDLAEDERTAYSLRAEAAERQLAEARTELPTLSCDDDCDGPEGFVRVCHNCYDNAYARAEAVEQQLGKAQQEARENICAAIAEREKAEASERQIAAVRAYCADLLCEFDSLTYSDHASRRLIHNVLALLDAPASVEPDGTDIGSVPS